MKEIKKKNWYVFYTSPRAEKKVNEYLLSLGYESFLPLKSEFKIWRNRQRKLIKSPLFPSYIFVLATRNDIFDINRIYGICYCVTCAGVTAVTVSYTHLTLPTISWTWVFVGGGGGSKNWGG
ncbi:hypothetical protein HUV05_20345, partial [Bacteroides vulgatus]